MDPIEFLEASMNPKPEPEKPAEVTDEAETPETETDPEAEGGEETEAASTEDPPEGEEKPKKENGYRRVKRQYESLQTEHTALREQHSEALDHAKFFMEENEALEMKLASAQSLLDKVKQALEEAGFDPTEIMSEDPKDIKLRSLELQEQRRKAQEEVQRKAQMDAKVVEAVKQLKTVAETYKVDPAELAKTYRASGGRFTIEETAKALAIQSAAKVTKAPARVVRKPAVAERGSGGKPDPHPNTPDGRLAWFTEQFSR